MGENRETTDEKLSSRNLKIYTWKPVKQWREGGWDEREGRVEKDTRVLSRND